METNSAAFLVLACPLRHARQAQAEPLATNFKASACPPRNSFNKAHRKTKTQGKIADPIPHGSGGDDLLCRKADNTGRPVHLKDNPGYSSIKVNGQYFTLPRKFNRR